MELTEALVFEMLGRQRAQNWALHAGAEPTEARVFELLGRLHAENLALRAEDDRLKIIITQHRCPEPEAPAVEAAPEPKAPKAPKARRKGR